MKKALFLENDDIIESGDFIRPLFKLEDGWMPDLFTIKYEPIEKNTSYWIGRKLGELNASNFKYEVIRWV